MTSFARSLPAGQWVEPSIAVRKITGSPSVRNFNFFLCNPMLVNIVNYYMIETHIYNLSHQIINEYS